MIIYFNCLPFNTHSPIIVIMDEIVDQDRVWMMLILRL